MADDPTEFTAAGTLDGPEPGGAWRTPSLDFTDRYVIGARLGAGGMGVVERARDRVLDREVALKTLRWDHADAPGAAARFENEASVTAGLPHPVIVPIYDRGARADGRPWYTMKLVEGRTLTAAMQAGRGLRRLVDAVRRVAEALAFAHRSGVVHRDVKPDNIMVGAFGEVLLLDWGIAGRVGDGAKALVGTAAYMAPEQITGGSIDRPMDVYALAVTLDTVFAGRARWSGSTGAVLAARKAEAWPSIDAGPPALRPLVHQALDPDPTGRPSAAEFAEQLRRWADGELGRERARALLERARACGPRSAELTAEAESLRKRAGTLLDDVPHHAPVADKLAGWRLEDAAEARLMEARAAEAEQLTLLRSALELAPDLPVVRAAVNDRYRARMLRAEAAGDALGVAEHRALLEAHDPTGNAEWLRGDGRVQLVTDAPDTTVEVLRVEPRDRRWVPVPTGAVWAAPLVDQPLAMGRYVLRLSAPGRMTVTYPVEITRQGHWTGVRPGGDRPHVVHLPPADSLDASLCYVPAGWCRIGGDPASPDAQPERRVWVDGFVVERDPACHGPYLDWLNRLRLSGQREAARRYAPLERTVGGADHAPFYAGGDDGPYALTRAYGQDWTPEHPVVRVDWIAATAFAVDRATREARPWRLVHSVEWDKAARGVDGRPFPWGDRFDPTWATMLTSRPESEQPAVRAVTAAPDDLSPYGLRGAAGNVRDLCLDVYRHEGPLAEGAICRPTSPKPGPDDFVTIKGGNYSSQPRFCRVAGRFGARATQRLYGVGFRLAYALDPYAT